MDACPSQDGSGSTPRETSKDGTGASSGSMRRNSLRSTSGLRMYVSYFAFTRGPRWLAESSG